MIAGRHRWGEPVRFERKTERACLRCGLVRVTRHDAGPREFPWREFWRGLERVEAPGTPRCEGVA